MGPSGHVGSAAVPSSTLYRAARAKDGGISTKERGEFCLYPPTEAEVDGVCREREGVKGPGQRTRTRGIVSPPEPGNEYLQNTKNCSNFKIKPGAQVWSGEDPRVFSLDTVVEFSDFFFLFHIELHAPYEEIIR